MFFSTASQRVAHCSTLHSEHFEENFIQKSKNILAVLLIETLIQISTSFEIIGKQFSSPKHTFLDVLDSLTEHFSTALICF